MDSKKVWIAVVVVAIIATIGLFTPSVQQVLERVVNNVGSVVSPDIHDHVTLNQNFTTGGVVVSTTTVDTSIVLGTGHRFDKNVRLIEMNIGVNATITTMASTSAPLRTMKAGESFSFLFHNSSTTAASTATFAAGTGVDLQEDNGGVVTVSGNDVARLTFFKKANTDVVLWVESGQEGD